MTVKVEEKIVELWKRLKVEEKGEREEEKKKKR